GGVTVARKIVRALRLQFRGETCDNDFALLLGSLGMDSSPFETATGVEASSTRSYEFEAEREAARYASSLIANNADVAASFHNLIAHAKKNAGNRFHISPAQVVTES